MDTSKITKASDHKVYFMLVRFTGVEVEETHRIEKREGYVEGCDESSLSSDSYGENNTRYDDRNNKDIFLNNMSYYV